MGRSKSTDTAAASDAAAESADDIHALRAEVRNMRQGQHVLEQQLQQVLDAMASMPTPTPRPLPQAPQLEACINPNCARVHQLQEGEVRWQFQEPNGKLHPFCGRRCAQDSAQQIDEENDLEAGAPLPRDMRPVFSSPAPSATRYRPHYEPYLQPSYASPAGAALGGRQPVVVGGHGNWYALRDDVRAMLAAAAPARRAELLSALGLREELYTLFFSAQAQPTLSPDARELLAGVGTILRHFNSHHDSFLFAGKLMASKGLSENDATLAAMELFGATDQACLLESTESREVYFEHLRKRMQKAAQDLRGSRTGRDRSTSSERQRRRGGGGRNGRRGNQQPRQQQPARQQHQQQSQQQQQQQQQQHARPQQPARGGHGRQQSGSRGRDPAPRSSASQQGGGAAPQ